MINAVKLLNKFDFNDIKFTFICFILFISLVPTPFLLEVPSDQQEVSEDEIKFQNHLSIVSSQINMFDHDYNQNRNENISQDSGTNKNQKSTIQHRNKHLSFISNDSIQVDAAPTVTPQQSSPYHFEEGTTGHTLAWKVEGGGSNREYQIYKNSTAVYE